MTPEALVVAWLRAASIAASSRHPQTLDEAWVRVYLIDDRQDPTSPALHVSRALVQADCYAGRDNDPVAADNLAEQVRARLHAMPGVHSDVVVTAVTGLSRRRLPDSDLQPARERYVVRADITHHPTPAS